MEPEPVTQVAALKGPWVAHGHAGAGLLGLAVLSLCLGSGCAARVVARPDTGRVDLAVLGTYILPLNAGMPEELSGAWYDLLADRLLVVSDDDERPALLWFELTLGSTIDLVAEKVVDVERPIVGRTLDLEGVAPATDRRLFVSSEGLAQGTDGPVPGIFEITREGRIVRQLPLPAAFAGLRANAGLEGLSASPDGRRLFAATETALQQDGAPASVEAGSLNRVLVYELATDAAPREYAYLTDPVPVLSLDQSIGESGIAEILALTSEELLVLERAYVEGAGPRGRSANRIRLYRVRLGASADVTGRQSLRTAPLPTALSKVLVFDLDTVAGALGDRLARLENFEAMAFGPRLEDGRGTLLLLSDNNRSGRQVTALVVLVFGTGAIITEGR